MQMSTLSRFTKLVASATLGSLVGGCFLAACDRPQNNDTVIAAVSEYTGPATATAASPSLSLQVLTNSCGANQVQDFFQITNTGSTAVPLSAIRIKFWPDDAGGQKVVPQVFYGGCVSNAGNPSCLHQVTGVTAAPTSFSACGPGPQQQANWEITVSNTDKALLPPGATWSNIQSQVHLANFGEFQSGDRGLVQLLCLRRQRQLRQYGYVCTLPVRAAREDVDGCPPGLSRAERAREDPRKRASRSVHGAVGGESSRPRPC